MIYVDPRIGSGHYVELLNARGVEAAKRKMQFGDIAFVGNGPGQQVMIGIEAKKPGDLISSLISKRLTARQLPGLMRTYDIIYLAILGRMKAGNTGGISTATFGHWSEFPTKLSWAQLQGMLSTLRHHAKVHVINFDRDEDFVTWIMIEYKRWQREWESHSSHIGLRVDQRCPPARSSQHRSHLFCRGLGTTPLEPWARPSLRLWNW